MKRTGIVVLLVVVSVSLLMAILPMFQEDRFAPQFRTGEVVPEEFISSAPLPPSGQSLTAEDAGTCRRFSKEHQKQAWKWARTEFSSWDMYLEKGYSLDEVTLAVQFFANSNFSTGFRQKLLRQQAQLVVLEEEINALEEVVQARREFSGLRLTIAIPHRRLEDFGSLSTEEKKQRLTEVAPSVEDMAFFLGQKTMSNDDVMLLLKAVDNPLDIVGSESQPALSLLDLAAKSGRLEAVEYLLKQGAEISTDPYLATSLDWALLGLDNQRDTPNPDQITIIELLRGLGAKASIRLLPSGDIHGDFPSRYFYEFDLEQQNRLLMEFGLDITSIETRELLSPDPDSALIRELRAQQQQYLNHHFGIEDSSNRATECKDLVKEIDSLWQPRDARVIIAEKKQQFGENTAEFFEEIAQIDPSLVDCITSGYKSFGGRAQRPSKEVLDEFNEFMLEKQIDSAIGLIKERPLTSAQRQWLIVEALNWDIRHYQELKRMGVDYNISSWGDLSGRFFKVELIKAAKEAGMNIEDADGSGRSLLFYMVKRKSPELLKGLYEYGVPFKFDSLGQDPLHLWLMEAEKAQSIEGFLNKVDVLKLWQPVIDKHHLSRVALIALRTPQLYKALVERHPQLTITEDTALPIAVCKGLY